jgi:membrane protein
MPFLHSWGNIAKHITFPGFDGVPILNIIRFIAEEMQKFSIVVNAKAIAYSFFLALFPGIIFIFTLIPYIPIDGLSEDLIRFIEGIVPNQAVFDLISPTIADIVNKPRGGLLSLGIISALYFTSNGVISMIHSFNDSLGGKNKRSGLKNQLIALVITIELILLFLFSIIVLVIGSKLIDGLLLYFGIKNELTIWLLHALRYGVTIMVFFFSIAVIYFFGPSSKVIQFKFISTGATVATILIILVALLFSKFVTNFNNYNKIYGSLGTIVFTMIWFYWNAFALLVGFEINKSIYYSKKKATGASSENQPL